MAIQSYEDWKEAVAKEDRRLSDVQDYLNKAGMERLLAFRTLQDMACFSETAEDLLEEIAAIINKPDEDSRKALASVHARGPVRALERIVQGARAQ